MQTSPNTVKHYLSGGSVCVSMLGLYNWHPAPIVTATFNSATSRTDVTVTLLAQDASGSIGNSNIVIRGSSATRLGKVTVNNQQGLPAFLSILDCCSGGGVAEVGQITRDGSSGEVILVDLKVGGDTGLSLAGDVGMDAPSGQAGIIVDGLNAGDIRGSLRNGITITSPIRQLLALTVRGDFQGDIAFTGASPTNNLINALDVRGDIYGRAGVGTTASFNAPNGVLEINARHVNANIQGNGNSMTRFSLGGNFTGSLNVGSILALSGRTNTPIFYVGGSIDGTIAATSLQLPATVDGALLAGRSISFASMTIGNNLQISGGISGQLSITGSLPASTIITVGDGGIQPTGSIKIGDSLAGFILLPANGLKGQVIINANNSTTPGVWTGNVTIGGSTTLTPAYYTQVSSDLGGGAVGLAPFHLYETDCIPPHNQISNNQGVLQSAFTSTAFPVRARFYGPLMPKTAGTWGNAIAIDVEKPPVGSSIGMEMSMLSMAQFNVRGPGDPGWTDARGIGIDVVPDSSAKAGVYRMRLRNDMRVRCDQVTGNPDVVWPQFCPVTDGDITTTTSAYIFRIVEDCAESVIGVPDADEILANPSLDSNHDGHIDACQIADTCLADINQDGMVTIDDYFLFINAYYTNQPTADVNLSGGITIDDLFQYINYYFMHDGHCD